MLGHTHKKKSILSNARVVSTTLAFAFLAFGQSNLYAQTEATPAEYEIPKEDKEELYKEFLSNYEVELSPEGNYNVTVFSKDKEKAAKMANDVVTIANNISIRLQKAEAETNRAYMDLRLKRTDSILNSIAQDLGRFSSQSLVFSPLDQAQAVSQALATL